MGRGGDSASGWIEAGSSVDMSSMGRSGAIIAMLMLPFDLIRDENHNIYWNR